MFGIFPLAFSSNHPRWPRWPGEAEWFMAGEKLFSLAWNIMMSNHRNDPRSHSSPFVVVVDWLVGTRIHFSDYFVCSTFWGILELQCIHEQNILTRPTHLPLQRAFVSKEHWSRLDWKCKYRNVALFLPPLNMLLAEPKFANKRHSAIPLWAFGTWPSSIK